ncbi:MAG: PDZ domain-containing protein, partial [Anaerolineales bacterium]|nr:PDZ domain-containing protein [Anaerolineales bacterium]
MDTKRSFLLYLVFLICFATAFAAGYFARDYLQPAGGNFSLLGDAYNILNRHGYYELPADPTLEHGMIRGMAEAYSQANQDPYTRFVEPAQHELDADALQGSYGGIGAGIGADAEGYAVLFPFPDSPAAQAGIQEGDRLLEVDGEAIEPGTPGSEIAARVRGPEGQKVVLVVARPPDYERFTITVERQNIPLPSVTSNISPLDPQLGIIQVNLIATSTAGEIEAAVEDLQSKGAEYFALDLRGNGGGLLDAGVAVASLFLSEGVVIE